MMQSLFSVLVLVVSLATNAAFDTEIFSDLVTSKSDEFRALEIKRDNFWQPILKAADDVKKTEYGHFLVYSQVEAALTELPAENYHAAKLLRESLYMLKRADEKVHMQAVQSSYVATEQLALASTTENSFFSFLHGGQNVFSSAIKSLLGGGRYSERLEQQVQNRQATILPSLRSAADDATNVLKACRVASTLAFDVLKCDTYNEGVIKTPKVAIAAANQLVDAVGETRHQFMQSVIHAASGIAKDSSEKKAEPSVTVTQELRAGLGEPIGTSIAI